MNRPRIIELIGPAGAGKSAVAECLAEMPGVLCTSMWFVSRNEFAWASVCTIPSAVRLMRRARAPLWNELVHIARLRALLNFLDRDDLSAYRLVVLDEGALYTLAWLRVIGHPLFRDLRTESFRHHIGALWAAQLDEVVRLDAPDAVLANRLRTRTKRHALSHAPNTAITAFTMRYRSAFDVAIGTVQRHGRFTLRDFRTDWLSPADIANQIVGQPAAHAQELVLG